MAIRTARIQINNADLIYRNQSGRMGIISLSGSAELRVTLSVPRHAIIFPRAPAKLRVKLGDADTFALDTTSVLFVTAGTRLMIQGRASLNPVTLLFFGPSLLRKTLSDHGGFLKRMLSAINVSFRVPRKTWLAELIHRYDFERSVAKRRANTATDFLESEILKELLCTHYEEKNPEYKYHFNVDSVYLGKRQTVIRKAIQFLDTNLSALISLDDLAKQAHTSRATLLRAFKEELGTSPKAYLRNRRLINADELLRKGDLPVARIAEAVGFQDTSYFIDIFKRKFGKTPLQARREAMGAKQFLELSFKNTLS